MHTGQYDVFSPPLLNTKQRGRTIQTQRERVLASLVLLVVLLDAVDVHAEGLVLALHGRVVVGPVAVLLLVVQRILHEGLPHALLGGVHAATIELGRERLSARQQGQQSSQRQHLHLVPCSSASLWISSLLSSPLLSAPPPKKPRISLRMRNRTRHEPIESAHTLHKTCQRHWQTFG